MIALTGATGFVGAALTRRLAAAGHKIQALIRPASTHTRPAGIDVRWIEGDLEDTSSLRRLVRGADAVVHCAGAVRGATRAQFNRVNVDGMARLVKMAADQQPMPNFLSISSLAAREPHLSPYAASKREGEKVLAESSDKLFWTVFRPSAIYGPGDRELMPVFRWMKKGIAPVLGSGNGRFSLLYVDDLAEAVLRWLDRGCDQRSTYELDDGHPMGYSGEDVIQTIERLRGAPVVRIKVPLALVRLIAIINLAAARAFGYSPMLTPGKVRELSHAHWTADNAALFKSTGWLPKIGLAEGLRRTLKLNNALDSENCS